MCLVCSSRVFPLGLMQATFLVTVVQSSENRFASLFEDEEEEVKTVKKEVRGNKSGRSNDKR